jgi:crotonobetainyl-CoA:carnitine CoA-transferase CaiB-like acyl-CoA transferase
MTIKIKDAPHSGPLSGLRVFDASMGAVGPWAGSLLGQMGAEVLKVESPQGDFIRAIRPLQKGQPTTYLSLNVSKRGVQLDMKDDAQRSQAHDLIAGADIFIENFRPGVAERIGLGWQKLSALNPRLIYASACGYGRSGPMVGIGATDPHVQAFCGSTSINGQEGSTLQRTRWYGHFDINTSMCIVQGVLAALLERDCTGKGRLVLVSMIEAAMALQRVRLAEFLAGGNPRPMGSATTYVVPDQIFKAADGFVAISATSQAQWQGLCKALERPDLADNRDFADNRARVANREALVAEIGAVIATRSIGHWLLVMARHDVPCAKPTSFDDFRYHQQYRENGMVTELDTGHIGAMTLAGTPWAFRDNPAEVRRPPLQGEHTDGVLANGWGSRK